MKGILIIQEVKLSRDVLVCLAKKKSVPERDPKAGE